MAKARIGHFHHRNIKITVKNYVKCGVDSCGSGYRPDMDYFVHGSKLIIYMAGCDIWCPIYVQDMKLVASGSIWSLVQREYYRVCVYVCVCV